MSLIVFSPHLDDGVLSASAQLVRAGATLLTVFGGVPPGDTPRGRWDRLTGAGSCAQRQVERLAENHVAADILGCSVQTWDELEAQYRRRPIDGPDLVRRIRSAIGAVDEIWVPVAIGSHPHHVAVRDLVLTATEDSELRRRVRFHSDLPYSLHHGWPTWVAGTRPDPYLDVDGWMREELVTAGLDPEALVARVHVLDADLRRLKERASLAYRSQMPALGLDPRDRRRWEAFLGYEVSWVAA